MVQSAIAPSPYAVQNAVRPSSRTSTRPAPVPPREEEDEEAADAVPTGRAAGLRSSAAPASAVTTRPSSPAAASHWAAVRVPASRPPAPAPSRPPRLYPAWKLGITGRPSSLTISTAALFMATFAPP